MNRTLVRVAVVTLVSLAFVAAAVAPRLSARLTGDEYRLTVQPVDPIDPFRGAYVELGYPGLTTTEIPAGDGPVYVTLAQHGGVWEADVFSRERPDTTPYLTCRDDNGWRVRCGIESYFLPQDEAAAMQDAIAGGEVVAVVRIDGRGHAALVGVEPA